MKFTVFTPTFNRCTTLKRLYSSLVSQEFDNFEWILIDDGSTDETELFATEVQSEKLIDLYYYKQENFGKQYSYNKAISLSSSDLFICVDSDDYLLPNCLLTLSNTWLNVSENNVSDCAGIVFLDKHVNGELIGTKLPSNVNYSNLYNLYNKFKVKGDKGLCFSTSILKLYQFPIFKGEKFITEAVLYNRIGREYTLFCLNKALEVCDYQSDGLSSQSKELMLNNPKGSALYFNELLEVDSSYKANLINSAKYCYYSIIFHTNPKTILREAKIKKFIPLGYLIGLFFYFKNKFTF